jgi:ribosome-binding factor A
MSRRTERMSSVIRRGAQSVLNEGLSDPRLDGALLTITEVRVSRDLRSATIMVSVMPENAERRAIAGLTAATRFVRRETADRTQIHRMPEFLFKLDRGMKRQAAVLGALGELRADDELPASAGDADAPATDHADDGASEDAHASRRPPYPEDSST